MTKSKIRIADGLGASWEGFALEQIINRFKVRVEECYYWGIHGQAELDLFIIKEGKRFGFEFKYADAPKLTKSMSTALHDLKLDQLTIIIPGNHQYFLADKIQVLGLLTAALPN